MAATNSGYRGLMLKAKKFRNQIVSDRKSAQERAKGAKPLQEHGGDRKSDEPNNQVDNVNLNDIEISNDGDTAKAQAVAIMADNQTLKDKLDDPATETKVDTPTFNEGSENSAESPPTDN